MEMLGKGMGGGMVALTTLLKFSVVAMGLSAFGATTGSAIVYSAAHLIQLLRLPLATKQPAKPLAPPWPSSSEILTAAYEQLVDGDKPDALWLQQCLTCSEQCQRCFGQRHHRAGARAR
jgi:hypothetical protein